MDDTLDHVHTQKMDDTLDHVHTQKMDNTLDHVHTQKMDDTHHIMGLAIDSDYNFLTCMYMPATI